MWALSTASSSVSAPGRTTAPSSASSATMVQVDLLVVEGDDVAAGREGPEVAADERRAEHDLGGHGAGGVVGTFGQHGHGQAERAGRLTGHAGQLSRADEPDRVGAQVARPRPGIRLDSGEDTTGTLREEHH